jgi:hypothetical protein
MNTTTTNGQAKMQTAAAPTEAVTRCDEQENARYLAAKNEPLYRGTSLDEEAAWEQRVRTDETEAHEAQEAAEWTASVAAANEAMRLLAEPDRLRAEAEQLEREAAAEDLQDAAAEAEWQDSEWRRACVAAEDAAWEAEEQRDEEEMRMAEIRRRSAAIAALDLGEGERADHVAVLGETAVRAHEDMVQKARSAAAAEWAANATEDEWRENGELYWRDLAIGLDGREAWEAKEAEWAAAEAAEMAAPPPPVLTRAMAQPLEEPLEEPLDDEEELAYELEAADDAAGTARRAAVAKHGETVIANMERWNARGDPLPLLLPPEPSPEMLAYDAARDVCMCATCVAPPQPCPREMAEGAARYARHAEASAAVLARIRGMPPY